MIFTISPVRHWKDGAEENTLSKSILNVAIHQLARSKAIYYFPAYEMVIDDLRDYRFYKEDMLHPNSVAVDYVWNGFGEAFFSNETVRQNKVICKIAAAIKHRPFNSLTKEHQRFLEIQLKNIADLKKKNATINFDKEIGFFKNQLIK